MPDQAIPCKGTKRKTKSTNKFYLEIIFNRWYRGFFNNNVNKYIIDNCSTTLPAHNIPYKRHRVYPTSQQTHNCKLAAVAWRKTKVKRWLNYFTCHSALSCLCHLFPLLQLPLRSLCRCWPAELQHNSTIGAGNGRKMMWKLCHNFWLLLPMEPEPGLARVATLHVACSLVAPSFYLFLKITATNHKLNFTILIGQMIIPWSCCCRCCCACCGRVCWFAFAIFPLSRFSPLFLFCFWFWPWAHYLHNGKLLLFAAIKYHWVMAGLFRSSIETFSAWRGKRGRDMGSYSFPLEKIWKNL